MICTSVGGFHTYRRMAPLLAVLLVSGCAGPESGREPLTAEVPLHLEEHLESATLENSEVPSDLPAPVEWIFGDPQPGWKPAVPLPDGWDPIKPRRVEDALRVPLSMANQSTWGALIGILYTQVPSWQIEDWGYVEIRARTSDRMDYLALSFNYTEEDPFLADFVPFYSWGDRAFLINDGQVHTYRLSLSSPRMRRWEGPWSHLAIWFRSHKGVTSADVDLLSVRVIPAEAEYMTEKAGVRLVGRGTTDDLKEIVPDRRTLYMHAPGRLSYRVRVPDQGRLDVGLGVLQTTDRVTYAITARREDGEVEKLLEETYADPTKWGQRSVDLSHLAGETVTLALETETERPGTVAFWAAPTLSGARGTDRPNVIFYVIDGGSPDYMSVYHYNRRTTPNLEKIAAEGAVFDHAFSNSSWTRPSTPSFMTSLQHSVLGGLENGRNRVPDQVLTMAEHFHRAGYQTGVFTSNSNAGRMSGLDRGVDMFRDGGLKNYSASSVVLQENLWQWRKAYPGEPYWVHFQTTDVHNDHHPVAPFAGLFIGPERRRVFNERLDRINQMPETDVFKIREAVDQLGIDQAEFWSANRDLHDETMAHQDYQLGRLVARLKAAGEWERTLLVIASDHGVGAGTWDFGMLLKDPQPRHVYREDRAIPLMRSGLTRIPLILIWPGHIPAGRWIREPVSMIDMLPTLLDLANLPRPEVMQGQSLVPLLLGEPGWEPRPVIFDEFEVDAKTGELGGRIGVMDGRWGASLEVHPDPDLPPDRRRPSPLLLYDLWSDPYCLSSLHEERPDLVAKYQTFLEKQFEVHRNLASRFTRSEDSPLTPEQLETLRSLGYIQ